MTRAQRCQRCVILPSPCKYIIPYPYTIHVIACSWMIDGTCWSLVRDDDAGDDDDDDVGDDDKDFDVVDAVDENDDGDDAV